VLDVNGLSVVNPTFLNEVYSLAPV
jgi:hypothetical protein